MGPRLQDVADQPGQHAARPHLDKGAHPGLVHGLDLLDEANWVGKLIGQQIPHGLGITGIGRGRGVGKDRDLWRCHGHRGEELAQGLRSRADQRRMKRRRDFEPRRRHALFTQTAFHL